MSMYPNPWAVFPTPPPPGTQPTYAAMAAAHPAHPAYTPVQVRQSFGYPPPVQQSQYVNSPVQYYQPPPMLAAPIVVPQQAPPQKKKIEWPQPVKNYVQRCFEPENAYHDVSTAEMQARLKQEIHNATESDTLLSIDWEHLPLPQEMIRAERASQRQASGTWVDGRFISNPSSGKKRKLAEDTINSHTNVSLPWRGTNENNGFENRVTYVSTDTITKKLPEGLSNKAAKKQHALEKRQKRFDGGYKSTYHNTPTSEQDSGPVVGRCQTLEKKYFRLTSAPNPDHVRPVPVLRKTFELLKKKWKKESNYSYICDQFKSLRQDLTVQHITNEFTVEVYEVHARIALEKGDLGEYNQCQTQLRALYSRNIGGGCGHPVEFKAYRILYFIHTCNRTALNDVLAELTPADKKEEAVKHALDVRSALALGNYHKFFRLYLDTPNMGGYLMDMFVARERLAALANICKAYKQDVKLRFITEELAFESDAEAVSFICEYEGGEALLIERDDEAVFLSAKSGGLFETARAAAFHKIDIKGQI